MAKKVLKMTNCRLGLALICLGCIVFYISFMSQIPNAMTGQNIIWAPFPNRTDPILQNAVLLNKTKELTQTLQSKINDLQAQQSNNKRLQQELDTAQHKMQIDKNKTNDMQKTIDKLQKQLNAFSNELKQAKTTTTFYHHKMDELKQQIRNITHIMDEMQKQLEHKQAEMNFSKQKMHELRQTIQNLSQTTHIETTNAHSNSKRYDFNFMTSYDNWIRGIGDQYLSNDVTTNCLFPAITNRLSFRQVVNTDIYHKGIDQCINGSFTTLYQRTLTIACNANDNPMIAEFEDIYHSDPTTFQNEFKALNSNNNKQSIFVYKLKRSTQVVWIKCGDSYDMKLSLRHLFVQNNEFYEYKKDRIKSKFGISDSDILPPNIVIFVLDSISRSNFIRSAPMTTDYLSHLMLNPESKTNVFEFFRYSTVGNGHAVNLAALTGGTCMAENCNETAFKHCVGLSQFYDKLGYYVPGFSKYNVNETSSNLLHKNDECDFYLSTNVFPNDCISHQFNIDYAQQFVLESVNHKLSDVPYFMILDTKNNNMKTSEYSYVMDKYLRDLIENIDKTNTILHIISADGGYNEAGNVFGQWESNNPVSIMLLPQYLTDDGIVSIETLRQNQLYINHYDMNLFYKELMLRYMKNEASLSKYKSLIHDRLPKTNPTDSFVFGQSILNGEISNNRTCDHIINGNCFCDVMQPIKVTKTFVKDNINNIELIVDSINNFTGNGQWDCKELHPMNFTISMYLVNSDYTFVSMVIQQTPQSLGVNRKSIYNRLKEQGKVLAYSVDIQLLDVDTAKVISIVKLNSFKNEKCLITNYNISEYIEYGELQGNYLNKRVGDDLEPFFANKQLNIDLIKNHEDKLYDLRLCRCKDENE